MARSLSLRCRSAPRAMARRIAWQVSATMANANGKQNVWRTQSLDLVPLRAPPAEVVLLAEPFQLTFTHRIVLVTCSS